jgi:hypothetical protein
MESIFLLESWEGLKEDRGNVRNYTQITIAHSVFH